MRQIRDLIIRYISQLYKIVYTDRDPDIIGSPDDKPAGEFSRLQKRKWVLWINSLDELFFIRKDPRTNDWKRVYIDRMVVKTTAQSNSTVAFSPITNLFFDKLKPGIYDVKAKIVYDTAATTTGCRMSLTGANISQVAINGTYPSTNVAVQNRNNNVINTGTPSTSSNNTKFNLVILEAKVIISAVNGIIQVSFASEIAGSAITVLPGSSLQILKL